MTPTPRRVSQARCAACWLAAAGVAVAWAWVAPGTGAVMVLLFWLTGAVALGRARNRMTGAGARRAWGLLVAATGLAVAGNVARAVHGAVIGQEFPLPSLWAEPLIVAAYACFVLAGVQFIRYRSAGWDVDAWIDAATAASAIGFVLWVVFLSPYATDPGQPLGERLVNGMYFAVQLGLLTTTIRLLAAPGVRAASYYLLAAGTGVLVVADLAGSVAFSSGIDPFNVVILNSFTPALAIIAANHHTAERLTAPPLDIEPRREGRLWPLSWLAVLLPVVALVVPDRPSPADRVEAAVGTVVLLGLLGSRATRLVRSRSRLLARVTGLVEIADDLTGRSPEALDRSLATYLPGIIDQPATVRLVRTAGSGTAAGAHGGPDPDPELAAALRSGTGEVRAALGDGHLFALAAPHDDGLWVVVASPGVLNREERFAIRSLVRSWSAGHAANALQEERHQRRSDRRFRALVQDSCDVVALVDPESLGVTMVSPSMQRILGHAETAVLGRDAARHLHPADRVAVEDLLANAVIRPHSAPTDIRVRHLDGHYHWFSATVRDLTADSEVGGLVLNLTDIHHRKMAELSLSYSEQRYRAMVLSSRDVFLVLEQDLAISYISPNVEQLLDFPAQDLVSSRISSLLTEESAERLEEFLAESRGLLQQEAIELELRTPGRQNRIGEVTLSSREGDAGGYLATIHDVTEQRRLERNLRNQALYDALTGLANRTMLHVELQQSLQRLRAGEWLALIHLDVNDFKSVNESVGYEAGDDLLVEVAARLRSSLRSGDTLARVGGNEFAIAAVLDGEDEILPFAERIRALFEEPFEVAGRPQRLGVSVGLDATGERRTVARALMDGASLAVGAARNRSQDHIQVFEPSLRASATERFELGADLGGAISRDELSVVYQPIVEMDSRRVRGVEALLRWTHPKRGPVSPGVFIPLAEKSGLVIELGRWVMARACEQLRTWHETVPGGHALTMSVNVSALQLERPGEAALLAEIVVESGVEPGRVTVELTESTLIEDAEWIRSQLEILRDLGMRVAVDDFGTGAAGLSHLRDVPFNVIKIDKSYVDALHTSDEAKNLVRGVIDLAHSLGAETVAEGIEDPMEFELLRTIGCELGQGFYLARPMDPEQLEAWFALGRTGSVPALIAQPSGGTG